MLRFTLCFILAVAASDSSAQSRERNLSSLFSDEEQVEAEQDSAKPRSSAQPDSQKSPPATSPRRVSPPLVPQSQRWCWVNIQVSDRPGCIPLNEEPLNSLASHFGTASMRVVQDAKHSEGRIMTVEVQTRTGPEAYVYATSESICNRIRTAALAATKDIKSSQSKNAQFFQLEPADLAKVRVKDPSVFCAGDLCTTKHDDFIRFQGQKICQTDIMFSPNPSEQSSGCKVSSSDAQRIMTTLRNALGAPALQEKSIPPTRSTHYVWNDGPLKVEFAHFWGSNIHGHPLNSWSISVSRR
jgi:hypothetical protein